MRTARPACSLIALLLSTAVLAAPAARPPVTGAPAHGPAVTARRDCPEPCPTLYVVGTAHLDTQWLWTIQDTIREYIPRTLHDNFALFERYPGYVFSFEGAFRYMLAKEYDPRGFERLEDYVDQGRWRVAGSAIDAGDVNIPSPESLVRHVLYGNGYFKRTFGKTSADIFLPDCFGFGWALPTIAAHCGLRGFSTQKLTWGSSVGRPVRRRPVGRRRRLVGDRRAGAGGLREPDHGGPERERGVARAHREAGARVGHRTSPIGTSGRAIRAALPTRSRSPGSRRASRPPGPVRVLSTGSDQLARDLSPAQIARLPRYRGELLDDAPWDRLLHLGGRDEAMEPPQRAARRRRGGGLGRRGLARRRFLSQGGAARGVGPLPLAPPPRRRDGDLDAARLSLLLQRRGPRA